LLELRYDDGFVHFISVEQFLEDRRELREVRRSRGDQPDVAPPEDVPLQPLIDERARVRSADQQDRGRLRDAALKVVRVLRLVDPTDSPAGIAGTVAGGLGALAVVSRIEGQLSPAPGIYQLASPSVAEPFDATAIRGGEPALVFIHGTASSLEGSFGGLVASKAWETLQSRYPRRILGLQHRTLSVSPVQNALDLVGAIPAGTRVHLVSHSRGGLVGELLCLDDLGKEDFRIFKSVAQREDSWSKAREGELDLLTELAARLREKQLRIERFVRVACPARGTLLASGRLDRYLNIILNLMGLIPGLIGNPVYDFSKSLILALISQRANPADLPGLEAQMPESPLIALLNQDRTKSSADLGVIAGDMEGSFGELGLFKKLDLIATDLFYRTEHDLVVDTDAMTGGTPRARGGYVFPTQGPEVNHFRYFANKTTADRLVSWLGQKPGEYTDTSFLPIVREDGAHRSLRGPSREQINPTAPVVFLLPGIMGSHLTVAGRRVWLDFVRIARAGMTELDIDAGGVEADGLVAMSYATLTERLGGKNTVIPFPYDWRKSIETQADALARMVKAELELGKRPIRILAHSMGGLVARSMIARDKDLWRRVVGSGGRLIMLGTPNRGSYVIPRLLFGVDRTLRMLALLDTRNNRRQIGLILAKFPGVLEMLPETEKGEYFDPAWWKQWQDTTPPSANDLQRARAVRDKLKDAIDASHMIYIAGFGRETPAGLRTRGDGKLEWLGTARGDGTVPYDLGLLHDAAGAEVPTYYAAAQHGDLANFPAAFDAIEELLEFGSTTRLPKLPPAAARDLAPDEPLADDEPLPYPTERELAAAALGASVPRALRARKVPPLEVSVSHGDLRLLQHPVVVGHYAGDSIVSAERVLDQQLHYKLTMRARLGLYPGATRTVEMILEEGAKPPGAIVVGLGEVGEITGEKVRLAVMDAALRYALQASECLVSSEAAEEGAQRGALTLGVLLLGTNGGNALPVAESVGAIVRGVLQANQALRSGEQPARCWIGALEFIELFETVATRALHALLGLDPHRPGGFESAQSIDVTRSLRRLGGGRFNSPLSEYEGGWWRRILVTWKKAESPGQPDQVKYEVLTDRARSDERSALADSASVDAFLARGIRSTSVDRTSSAMLYALLVPPELRERARSDARDLVLIVDEVTARYPWEMIISGAGTDVESFALRYGLLRQFKTTATPPPPQRTRGLKAVVIGEPANVTPALPGARAEAQAVSEILSKHDYIAPARVGLDSLAALSALFEDCRILHVAAHGDYREDDPARSGIVLGESERFTAYHVNQLTTLPELVFINCCHLGAIDQPDKRRSSQPSHFAASLARRYIERGVKAIVVAGWAVDDAAATTFARTFYGEMLAGRRFGQSVCVARRATYDRHPEVNTWAAYQCYGDPEYTLEIGRSDGAGSGQGLCSRTEFLYELRGLASDAASKDFAGRNTKSLKEKIQAVSQQLIEEWRDGEILAALGDAWAAVAEHERAVECYRKAFEHPTGGAPLRAIEQFANRLERATYAELKELPAGRAGAAKRKDLAAKRKNALQQLELLIQLSGATGERLNLRAAFSKRSSGFEPDARKASALAAAGEAYRAAFELALKQTNQIDPYPGTNWITLAFLGGATTTDELLEKAEEMIEAARELVKTSADRWLRIHEADAILVRYLIADDLAKPKAKQEILNSYRRARDAGFDAGQWRSVTDQLRFIEEMLRKSKPKGRPIKNAKGRADALASLIPQIEEME
jgi:pimeloyl-ACP methyl ester carboxylesterase